jgi:hypothetical protein
MLSKNSLPPELQNAAHDLRFLLNRGYHKKGAVTFVANKYLLDLGQRNFLQRTVFPREKCQLRMAKIILISNIKDKTLLVDGYNVLITAESICAGEDQSIVTCDDGVLRDVNAVFGKYKFREATEDALNSIIALINIYQPDYVRFFYDSPVSFSGELAKLTEQIMEARGVPGSAETLPNVDYELVKLSRDTGGVVASSDSVIMDKVDRILDIPCFLNRLRERDLVLI